MPDSTASVAMTRGVRVEVAHRFDPFHSKPEQRRFVISYEVTFLNERDQRVQLFARRWIIIDGDGHRTDIQGTGVAGFTPILKPGQTFTYSPFCPLETNFRTVEGTYELIDEAEKRFEVAIGRFYLVAEPGSLKLTLIDNRCIGTSHSEPTGISNAIILSILATT